MIFNKVIDILRSPKQAPSRIIKRIARVHMVSDELAIKLLYWNAFHTRLDLNNPSTFNSKLQWLKLHDRNPLYSTLVDKYLVKQWVSERIGEEHVPKTLGAWTSVDNIDIDELPERFVLKTNHDNGGIAICKNRDAFDLEKAKEKLDMHLKRNFYWINREWPYKGVSPLVFAEEYIESDSEDGDLVDYKILCFGGVPRLIEVHKKRYTQQHTQDWYDCTWNRLDIGQNGVCQSAVADDKPALLDEALEFSRILSQGLPHVRVDWYFASARLLLGELTLYDGAGYDSFDSIEWDELLGSWIDLNMAYCYK